MSWHAISPPAPLRKLVPGIQAWQREVADGHLSVFVGVEDGGWHLSISHRRADTSPGRLPSWDELKDARYRFCPDAVTMAMLLPPQAEYVNLHPTTFHLWQV
jgi:hypothetical protein